jgi:hypothetical protein
VRSAAVRGVLGVHNGGAHRLRTALLAMHDGNGAVRGAAAAGLVAIGAERLLDAVKQRKRRHRRAVVRSAKSLLRAAAAHAAHANRSRTASEVAIGARRSEHRRKAASTRVAFGLTSKTASARAVNDISGAKGATSAGDAMEDDDWLWSPAVNSVLRAIVKGILIM